MWIFREPPSPLGHPHGIRIPLIRIIHFVEMNSCLESCENKLSTYTSRFQNPIKLYNIRWSVVLLHIFPGYTHSSTFYLHIHYYHHSTYVCNYPAEEFDWRVWNRLDDSLLLWETLICKLEMNEISLHTRRVKIPAAG